MATIFGEEFDHLKLQEQEWLSCDTHTTPRVLLVLCLGFSKGWLELWVTAGFCCSPFLLPGRAVTPHCPTLSPMDTMRHILWFLTASGCTAGAIAEPSKVRMGYFAIRANHGLLFAFLYVITAILESWDGFVLEGAFKIMQLQLLLPWALTPTTRSDCSELYPQRRRIL